MVNWIETMKNWSKDASLQIEFFFHSKQRKPIKSNHCSIKDRLDFCVFENSWRILHSSPSTRLVRTVFQISSFRWNFKFLKATCYSFQTIKGSETNYLKKKLNFDLFPLKNDNLFCGKTRPKKPEVFQNSSAWKALLEKRITLARRISSWINLNFFNGLLLDYSA